METSLLSLCIWAIGISFIHTASGPDHYLPFIALSKSRKWALPKTILLTIVCGFGHVMSSLVIGLFAVLLGWNLDKITWFQGIQGNVAGWILFIFGITYVIYGIIHAYKNKPHKHFDVMGDDVYVFEHKHGETNMPNKRIRVTPFVLFAVFVMGPSEPLAPMLFFSSIKRSSTEIVSIISVFTITTILTMLTMVLLGLKGFGFIKTEKLERFVHVIGGSVVTICATGMLFLNW